MAAPPPPPPPPPPGPSNIAKPANIDLLASICQGTSLKKVPEAAKNDRSAVPIGKPSGSISAKNNSGPLLPPSGKPMSIAEELAARKNASNNSGPLLPPPNKPTSIAEELAAKKNSKFSTSNPVMPANPKRTGLPSPNVVPSNVAPPPPPPPNSSKPINIAQFPPPIRPPLPSYPPSQPVTFQVAPPPPPPPKDLKPIFRPPVPICSKPMINNDGPTGRISQTNQYSGPIIPPPPPILPPVRDIKPPKSAPPPPPPFPLSIPVIQPMRSSNTFDSRFTFLDVRNFPDVDCFPKIR